jgi:hypothetical protein
MYATASQARVKAGTPASLLHVRGMPRRDRDPVGRRRDDPQSCLSGEFQPAGRAPLAFAVH